MCAPAGSFGWFVSAWWSLLSLLHQPSFFGGEFFFYFFGCGEFSSHNHIISAELPLYTFLPIPPSTGVEEGAFSARAL